MMDTRRAFLKMIGTAAAAGVLASCTEEERERLFKRSFRELEPDEVKRYLASLPKGLFELPRGVASMA